MADERTTASSPFLPMRADAMMARGERDVANDLRAALLRGDLGPDRRLIASKLADRHRTSRYHVLHALTRLESEGLVDVVPNRGAKVHRTSRQESLEIIDILEPVASSLAALAAQRSTVTSSTQLRVTLDEVARAIGTSDARAFCATVDLLHLRIAEHASHGVGRETMDRLCRRLSWAHYVASLHGYTPRRSFAINTGLVEAICCGCAEVARNLMAAHFGAIAAALVAKP